MFWDSIGNILVECFNESFAKGEMSSSQMQAVITLIKKKKTTIFEIWKTRGQFRF